MAKGAKYLGQDINVYTLLGDGEIEEGEVWEAFMFAAHYKLDNLCVVIDQLSEGLRKLILAGIGAVAVTKEKSEGILDELVKKGDLTVEQGKVLNEELKHNIKDAIRENVTLHVVTPEETFRGSPSSFLR